MSDADDEKFTEQCAELLARMGTPPRPVFYDELMAAGAWPFGVSREQAIEYWRLRDTARAASSAHMKLNKILPITLDALRPTISGIAPDITEVAELLMKRAELSTDPTGSLRSKLVNATDDLRDSMNCDDRAVEVRTCMLRVAGVLICMLALDENRRGDRVVEREFIDLVNALSTGIPVRVRTPPDHA